jgi:hypothetical protein
MSSDQWLLREAPMCSFLSLVFVIIINAAGTSIQHSTSLNQYNSPTLGGFYILQVSLYLQKLEKQCLLTINTRTSPYTIMSRMTFLVGFFALTSMVPARYPTFAAKTTAATMRTLVPQMSNQE